MHRHIHFWSTTLARGFVALFIGSAIWFVPDMAGSLLLLPMAIVLSVVALGVYGVVDSAFVLLSSTMVRSRPASTALRLQGLMGITVGVLLFAVVYEKARLEWFLLLAGLQALSVVATELVVARHTSRHRMTIESYGAAAVAFCFGIAYMVARFEFAESLSSREICWLIYGYLLAFGLFQNLTALYMLYGRHGARRSIHRVPLYKSSELPHVLPGEKRLVRP